ncbi:MAG: TRAP transporter small permease subunit [Alphaproteobacteria bacterium]|nr:TRAP transporter small permease subunit [Alphaproteobacteria bacterium]
MATHDGVELSPAAQRLATFDEVYFKLERFLNLIAALTILGLMFVGTYQVFGRKLLNFPVPGYVDVVEIAMTAFAFLGIAYCQKLGGHIRMEIILGRFKGRLLYSVELFGTVAIMLIIGILIFYTWDHFMRAWTIGDSTIDIEIILWPSKLVVPLAFTVLMGRLLLQAAGFARLIKNPDAALIAVPHIETVDEQAQHEIDAGLAGEEEKVDLLARNKAEAD